MKTAIALMFMVCISGIGSSARADGKKPPAPATAKSADHAAFPAPLGAPIEKPPARVSAEDLAQMQLLDCQTTNTVLQDRIVELEHKLVDAQRAQLAAKRDELKKRYLLDDKTSIGDDGTVVRKK